MTARREIQPVENQDRWNEILTRKLDGHLLQSWQWGQHKAMHGWEVERFAWLDESGQPVAAAQVLRRSVSFPILPLKPAILYCPRGPSLDWDDTGLRRRVLADLSGVARRHGAIFLKIDPPVPGAPSPAESSGSIELPFGPPVIDDLLSLGWRPSGEQIQFRNTLLLDLDSPEEDLLAGMKQKTRYNIRLAGRKGVTVRRGSHADVDLLYRMYAETAARDGFVIRTQAYYTDLWTLFLEAGLGQPFIAEFNGQPIAALVVYRFGGTATYLHGMSLGAHRNLMPNHLLQWEAIRWARSAGCREYDFWGAPDHLDETDPMWGVYRFKIGFGARIVGSIGAYDLPNRPGLYWLYGVVLPRLLEVMRRRGRRRLQLNGSLTDDP